MIAYKFKLKPAPRVAQAFETTLDVCRELYNAALQERRDAYQINGVSVNFHAQAIQLPAIKLIREDVDGLYSQVPQDVLRRLSKTFDSFFRRAKRGEAPGYPRFKSKLRYNSFTYPQSGFRLDGNKLTLSKLGSVRLRLSRLIEGTLKTCTIKRQVDGWFVVFAVEENHSRYFPKTGKSVGVDVGITTFAALSDGSKIANPQFLRNSERKLKMAQCCKDRRKKGGTNRKQAAILLARQHQHIANQRQDFFHKQSLELINHYDEFVFEDLNIAGMVKNHHLAKSICDAAWGTFLAIHTNKAENAGRVVRTVPAAFTSQDCSGCGDRVRKGLSERVHQCIKCGLVLCRDHNAAINIKARIAPLGMGDGSQMIQESSRL